MPTKKKTKPNSYFFFMKEVEYQLRQEGGPITRGMAEVAEIAAPRWKLLSAKEKEIYEEMAREYKRRQGRDTDNQYKMDNVGNIIAFREDPNDVFDRLRYEERAKVRSQWPVEKELIHEVFYFIHFNTLCTTHDGTCLPCEVGIVEYTMKDGIKKFFHKFIDPGAIPTGYRFMVQDKSDSTHQIPVQNFELADKDYTALALQLENFINEDDEKEVYPPVYCKSKEMEDVKNSLSYIHGRAKLQRPQKIRDVFEIEGLVVDMFRHVGTDMSRSMVCDRFATSMYDYNSKVQCQFHAEKDIKYCSLGNARRYAYIVSDNLADVYNFELTHNHLPDRSDIMEHISVISWPSETSSRFKKPMHHSRSSPGLSRSSPSSYQSIPESKSEARFPASDVRYKDDFYDSSAPSIDFSATQSPISWTPSDFNPAISTPGSVDSGSNIGVSPDGHSDDVSVYPIAPKGANVNSIFPQPMPPGMTRKVGRGWAPAKDIGTQDE